MGKINALGEPHQDVHPYDNQPEAARERRPLPRMHVPIPIRYRIHILEPSEKLWIGQGVLNDISEGGINFICEDDIQLEVGHSGMFTISNSPASPAFPVNSDIAVKALVKHIVPPTGQAAGLGVAIQFLSSIEIVPKDQNPPGEPAASPE